MPEREPNYPIAERPESTKTYVYPYVLRSAERVVRDLDTLLTQSVDAGQHDVNVVGVTMGIKSQSSEVSAGKLSPLSVHIAQTDPSEGVPTTKQTYQGLHEQTTLYMMPLDDTFEENERIYRGGSYAYMLDRSVPDEPEKQPQKHRASLMSVPAITPRILEGHLLNQEDRNYESLITLPLDKFGEAITTGVYSEGHDSWNLLESSTHVLPEGDSPVSFSDTELTDRNEELNGMLTFIIDREDEYKASIAHRIEMKLPEGAPELDRLSLIATYRSLMDQVGPLEARAIMTSTINAMHADLYSSWFRNQEAPHLVRRMNERTDANAPLNVRFERATRLRELLRTGNNGTDILHILPIAVQTREEGAYSTQAFADFESLWNDVYERSLNDFQVDFDRHMHDRRPETAYDRARLSSALHDQSMKEIAEVFEVPLSYVESCWTRSLTVVPEMGDGLKTADEEIRATLDSKVHELSNEIHNADLPELYHWYKNGPNERIRFEAGRQLMVFLHELAVSDTYETARSDRNRLFSTVIDDYFGADEGKTIEIGGRSVPVRHSRKSGNFAVIDEKRAKTEGSYSRKAWSAGPEKSVEDVYGYSIILDENSITGAYTPDAAMRSEFDSLISFLEQSYGKWFDVSYRPLERPGLDVYKEYVEETDPQRRAEILKASSSGKNTGSNGNRIVRMKTAITLTERSGDGKTQVCEFSLYPYADLPEQAREAGFMGWHETLNTHREYEVKRLTDPLKGAPGTRSLYDLFFPAAFYPNTHDAREVAKTKYGA